MQFITIINSSNLIINILAYAIWFGIIFILNGLNIIVGNYLGIWLRRYFTMPQTIYLGSIFITWEEA